MEFVGGHDALHIAGALVTAALALLVIVLIWRAINAPAYAYNGNLRARYALGLRMFDKSKVAKAREVIAQTHALLSQKLADANAADAHRMAMLKQQVKHLGSYIDHARMGPVDPDADVRVSSGVRH